MIPLRQEPQLEFEDEEQFLEPLPAPLDAEDVLVFGAGDEFDQLVVVQEVAAEAPIRTAAGERGVVLVAVHAGLRILGLSVVTDLCLPDALAPTSLAEILAVANAAEPKLRTLVRRVVAEC